MALHLRPLTGEETKTIKKWSQSRTEEARLVERAQIVQLASAGRQVPEIAATLGITEKTVRKWLKRFAEQGPSGLEDAPRSGAPSRYTPEVKARIIALALTNPREVGCKFNCWTFERLAVYVHEELGFGVKKTRIFEILHEEDYAGGNRKPGLANGSIPSSPKHGGHRAAPQGSSSPQRHPR